MSDLRFFEELGAELERVGRSRPEPRRAAARAGVTAHWGARLGAGIRATTGLLGVAVAIVIAAVVLLSVRHRERPPGGHALPVPASGLAAPASPVGSEAQRLINAAWESAEQSDRECVPRRPPEIGDGRPSASLLSSLSVLRGPDAGGALSSASHFFQDAGPQLGGGLYYERSARLARTIHLGGGLPGWAGFDLVPMGNAVGPLPPVARCYAEQTAALARELAPVTGPLRISTLALDARERAGQQHPEGIGVVVSLSNFGDQATDDVYRSTTRELAQHGLTGSGFLWNGRFVLSGIVPDGVATVTLQYPGRGRAAAFTVSAHPVRNIFVVQIPHRFAGARPAETVWRAASGKVIKTIVEAS